MSLSPSSKSYSWRQLEKALFRPDEAGPSSDLIRQFPLRQAPAYLEEVCYPAALLLKERTSAGLNYGVLNRSTDQIVKLAGRSDMSPKVAEEIFTVHARFADTSGEFGDRLFHSSELEKGMSTLLRTRGSSASLLGSIVRVLACLNRGDLDVLAERCLFSLAENPSSPLPVKAKIAYAGFRDQDRQEAFNQQMFGDEFLDCLDETYPELEGLPFRMRMEVLAALPMPDEWFVDIWPSPEMVWVGRKSLKPLPPVWDELVTVPPGQ